MARQIAPALKAICPSWYSPPEHHAIGGIFLERAANVIGISVAEIKKPNRSFVASRRRFAIAHVMRESLKYSYPRIALILNYRDHSTTCSGVARSKELVKTCPDHAAMVDALEMAI
jgi:chromosomal replication initiation ATPase DnaA